MAAAAVRGRVKRRPAGALDVAASALVRVLPRRLVPAVSQARLDARTILDGLRGERTPAFSSHASPPVSPTPLGDIDPVEAVLPGPLADRYATLRRDLGMVVRELRGERAPSLVPRPSRAAPAKAPAASALPTRTLEVVRVIRETEDARTFELRDVSGAALPFVAGQFLTLHVSLEGASLRRAYSISSSPGASEEHDRVRITVKRIAGGRVSGHLVGALREGDRLEAHGPSGSFVVPPGARRLILVAGGSGITPIASIARHVLAADAGAHVTLVYGNRSEADVIFGAELAALAARHAPRLSLVHVLSEPATAAPCVRGIPDRETLARIVDEHGLLAPDAEAPVVMTCGPQPMMAAVREVFEARGVPGSSILEERFLSPGDARGRARASGPQRVTLRVAGASREIAVAPEETVLEAALARGVPMPFSCQMGGCGACRVKGEGALAMDEPNCLSAAEKRDGYVLTCVTRALGPACVTVGGGER